jgi:hypothetical protein
VFVLTTSPCTEIFKNHFYFEIPFFISINRFFFCLFRQRDEDSELALSPSQSGNYEFNNQPSQAPEWGL